MVKLRISKRLKRIASYVPKGAYFADIGTDHAYLASYICMQDKEAKGIASDVNEGPLQAAKKTITNYDLADKIDLRLGNGLDILTNEKPSTIIIAGMGGSLIKKILSEGKKQLSPVERLILQPNIGEGNVRKWLITNNYNIVKEEILEENGKIYEIIIADQAKNKISHLTEKELFFGPFLLREESKVFRKKWKEEKKKLRKTIEQMEEAVDVNLERLTNFRRQLHWIEEVLKNE